MVETVMKMPALAVVGADHRIVQSTESFRQRYAGAQALCEESPELEQVLTGQADTAVISVGDLSVEIEAVTDEAGRRHAMLSLPPEERSTAAEPPTTALCDAAEESSAIVWVKDLDGRYLYANPRYLRDLETTQERLSGNTDGDLPEAETVDGPRRRYAADGFEEPLQLEYTVPAIDHRPALTAFRFALRDEAGQPIGTCGVAAPVNEAQIARDEAVRLMQLERWNRLDPMDARAELLEQWHVHAAGAGMVGGAEPYVVAPEDESQLAADPEAAPEDESGRQWAERAGQLERELQRAQAQMRDVKAESEQLRTDARAAAEEAERWRGELNEANLALERTRADAQAELEQARAEAKAEVKGALAELEQARAEAQARTQVEAELERVQADAQGELEQVRTELEQAQMQAEAELERVQGDAQAELEQVRAELEQAQVEVQAAHAEAEAARAELGASRAQVESLRGPSTSALRLSEELGRALGLERERGDELERALARIRTRLGDFETALERKPSGQTSDS
jgi:PAS domain-containing protein